MRVNRAFWRLLFVVLLSLVVGAVRQAVADAPLDTGLDPNWKLVSDRDGIQVYMRHHDTSRLKTFRGVTRIALPDEYSLAAVLNDYASYPQWLHFVDGAEEFKRDGPLKRYLRFTTRLPWPLSDREAILEADVLQKLTPREESVTIELINRPGLLPPNDGYVRFPEMHGIFKMRRLGHDQVEVTYQLIMDPGGYIPAWLANILLRDAPYFTLEKLRRIITRPEYQRKFYSYLELRGPGRPKTLAPPRSYIYGNPPDRPFDVVPLGRVNELKASR